jgi:hypothetical protein
VSEISRIVIVNIFPVWNYIDMATFNVEQRSTWFCSFGKRAGKVGRFFEDVEQGLGAVNAVAFGLCRLLHNSNTLQPLDCALCGRECGLAASAHQPP